MKQLDTAGTKRILIRGTNWVGDAIMSIPAMREIRHLFPDAHISLLVRPWVKDVYSAVEFVDEILEYDKNGIHQGWLGFQRLTSNLRQGRFDLAIILQNAFEAALIAWLAGIPQRVGYARDFRSIFLTHACRIDPEVRKVHQAYYYLGILSGVDLLQPRLWLQSDHSLPISIGIRETDRQSARQILQSYGIQEGEILVGINPGASYGGAKRWFSERYATVADALAEQNGARIVIFGSQNEHEVAEQVAAGMKHSPIVLAGRTTLGQLMALLKECRLLITNDSGPMHLAAALDVPQLAIFGSTSEVATGPLSNKAEVIKHPADCSPCFLRECPSDFRCMDRISIEQVLTAAQNKLP